MTKPQKDGLTLLGLAVFLLVDAASTPHIDTASASGKVLKMLATRPASVALTAAALAMLAVLVREARKPAED